MIYMYMYIHSFLDIFQLWVRHALWTVTAQAGGIPIPDVIQVQAHVSVIQVPSTSVLTSVQIQVQYFFPSDPHPSIHRSIDPSIHQFIHPVIHSSACLSVHPSIDPSINPSINQLIDPSIHRSIDPSIHPFIHPSILLFFTSFLYAPLVLSVFRYVLFISTNMAFDPLVLEKICLLHLLYGHGVQPHWHNGIVAKVQW